MLQYLWLIPLGLVTGTYATLVGLGGGFVIVPLLLMLYPNINPEVVTSISLAVVCVNASSGTWAYVRMKRIDYHSGIIFAVASIPGAVLGAIITAYIPRPLFETLFGVIMIGLSVFLFVQPERKSTTDANDQPAASPQSSPKMLWIGIGLFVGFLSSLLGIGGGIILVPLMIYLLRFPVFIATATSLFILAISSLSGTLTHLISGNLSQGIWQIAFLAPGVILGSQIGARLSSRMQGVWIIRALALALGITGIKFVFF